MFDNEQFVNNQHPMFNSHIERKISRQKPTSEHRSDHQLNGNHIFESPPPRIPHSRSFEFDSSLRNSTGARSLHDEDDVILTNGFDHQTFHPPQSRKVTKITPKENQSISNSRPIPPRSSSASSALTTKHENKDSALTPSDIQRLKNVRRHEPAHVPSGPESKKSLITPDSWKSYPVILKPRANKKPPPTVVTKSARREKTPDPVVKQPSPVPDKPKLEKPKQIRSAIKPKETEPPPAPKIPKKEKTKEEIEKIRKYMLEKRQEHEQNLTHEKQLKQVQERERKDKLKKLNEQIKKVAQQPLPAELTKKLASTTLQNRDQVEQTRERLLQLLGPREISEPPAIYHPNTPFEQAPSRERSPSPSSSSSSESIVEIQPPKIEPTLVRPLSEQSIPTGAEQRQQNLLRWALNLTRDCNHIEDKLKYLRPDGTQPFDLIPASRPNPRHDDGNLRSQTPIVIKNNTKPEPIVPSKVLRPSGRLIKLNKNRANEYQGQDLPGVGNLRDPVLEQRIKRDRAAAKIQAAYRGYSVRKSIHWLNDRKQRLNDQSNKRPARKPTKPSRHPMDLFDTPALNLDMRLSDDNFTIGSTLLRNFQRNGTKIIPSAPAIQPQQEKIRPQSTPLQTYSDDYEHMTSTRSSTPRQQKQKPEKARPVQQQPIPEKSRPVQLPTPEKPRVIQQLALRTESTSSRTSSTSSSSPSSSTPVSSSVTPTPTPEPPNVPHRRSISPPLPAQISSNNGRLIHPPPSFSSMTTTARRTHDERRYSPDALERQLNAELHLLDGVEASMKQVDNMERLRSVALAQQEVVSLAQILKNKPATETSSEQTARKPARQVSSSPTTTTSSSSSPTEKQRVRSRPRQSESTSSSSETILTAREKRARQKFHSETELQAYEKRLKDVEQKIRSLDKRAADVFTEKRTVASPRSSQRLNSESSISEDLPVSQKSISSKSPAVERKNSNGISEIRTETYSSSFEKETDSSQKHQSVNTVTTDGSDIERRIRAYQDQIQKKKNELDHLKQRKNKDSLRRQEGELKKQLESYNHQIETLRTQPITPSVRKSPLKKSSSSSSSGSSTPTKPPESSIAEELPASTTASQSKTNNIIKKKERDFFEDDDDDDEEEEEKKKPTVVKPLETPRDERDTQHDAQSLSIATDIGASSETENDASRRPSTDIDKPILNLNTNVPSSLKPKDESDLSSSSSTTTTTTSKKSAKIQTFERKSSPVVGDYDEDFSDASHSPATPTKQTALPKSKIDDIDVESIQEDLEEKPSLHDTNQSLSSKSSGDEQSEILVLVKKSASNTPRRQEDKTLEEEFPPPPPPVVLPPVQPTTEVSYNDDTSHDVSEEEEEQEEQEQVNEKENKIDQLTDSFLRAFIDDAIDQGQKLKSLKKDNVEQKISLTQEAKEWVLDDDSPDDDEPRANESETNEFTIDLSGLGEKNADEPRVESPRKIVVEEPIKPFIPHTREQVIHVCDEALKILLDQNNNFSDRSAIRCRIPPSYFTTELQDADKEDIRHNHHAYCQMIFDLCVEILHEMDTENIQAPQHPEWQKAKLVSKRFFRGIKPHNRREIEQIVRNKILELLNVNARPINYSKWRIFNNRRPGIEKFESVLDDEIRRSEPEWITYDTDSTQLKFDIADVILDQLIQETLTECLAVVNQRFYLNSNSTRL